MASKQEAKEVLKRFWIETPSWAYANSGTRFKVFAQPGVPRDPYEKIADAAQVHKYTGAAPSVAMHIPWDKTDDYAKLAKHAKELGVRLGTVNSNTFQDDDYKYGSVCHFDKNIRQKAVDHLFECIEIMNITGAQDLKLWFADGTNYPGQDDLAGRQDRLFESLQKVYARLGDNQRMLLEYKFFEPAFYSTDVPDWGTSYVHCTELGPKATVCVDTGHHAPGTNIEYIVAFLLRRKRLGAFDFNSRFYADDDLIVGAADPFQLFRIMHEVNQGGGFDKGTTVSYVLDQCHNIEPKIPAQIRSITNVQEAVAKALIVDADALKKAQLAGDVLGANDVLMNAYNTDVRDLLGELRSEQGLATDPKLAYAKSGYAEKIAAERVGGAQAGWGSLMSTPKVVSELLARSNKLGAEPRFTNYAGGNTSAKGVLANPATGKDTTVLWVKGSGGDLGTLKEAGLAALDLEKFKDLVNVYPGVEREDEMVALFDYCAFGKGGAAPSIDTSMHGLVEFDHVDHLHPDSIIALATSKDGKKLTAECFGEEILWVDWRRPGFQLGLDMAKIAKENPKAKGCVLGGHGLTTWGVTSKECEERSIWAITKAEEFIKAKGKADPFGKKESKYAPLDSAKRKERAAALAPYLRGIASKDVRMLGSFTDNEVVLDFLQGSKLMQLAALGTSCPDHFLRTKISPMVLDTKPDAPVDEVIKRANELHEQYRKNYAAYYDRNAKKDSPAMRGADPLIILVPGVGMFSYGKDKQTARVAGEFYINAINVMRGAEALSTYAPIAESEKFRIEYWDLEEAKLKRMPKPKPLAGKIALVTGAASGLGKATAERLAAEGACVVVADRDLEGATKLASELGGKDKAIAVAMDVTSEEAIADAMAATMLAFGGIDIVVNNAGISIAKPITETTVADWDLQLDIMARGSFLVSREAAKALKAQGMGGDIIYISSKNSVFAGANNVAYGATKAAQSHQVRLLAVELGEFGIRVNGINPDGVVKGSGIFAGGWGANRAKQYGVEESKLGEFYAQRTILKKEVLPEHIAAAVFVILGGDLTLTTGLHIPVDGGVAAAFLR